MGRLLNRYDQHLPDYIHIGNSFSNSHDSSSIGIVVNNQQFQLNDPIDLMKMNIMIKR